jgi:hypothetical protein
MSQRPMVLGLLICEQVIIEEQTRNVTLVNCFTRLKAAQFPTEPKRFVVFAALTDGQGDIQLDLMIERLDTLEEIYRESRRVGFTDRLQEVRFVLRVTDCSFPVAGPYEISLKADGELLAAHKFRVE